MMVQRPTEPVVRRGRDLPSASAPTDPPPLTPQDLVPHLRGLARALRERGGAPPGGKDRA